MKLRIKFSKLGYGKYISHLDMIRCWSRALCRAELPVKYSEGFNPHQQMSFLLPLPIGVTSDCELVDIEFAKPIALSDVKEKLNANLPPDLKVLDVYIPDFKAKDISFVEYDMSYITNSSHNTINVNLIKDFLSRDEFLITKTSKRGKKTVNMMEYIHSFKIIEADNSKVVVKLLLNISPDSNLKPTLIAQEIENVLNPTELERIDIHRANIYQMGC